MTTSPETPRTSYVADGATDTFATGFIFATADEVVVTVAGFANANGTDYDLDGLPGDWIETGANVVFRAGAIPPAETVVLIVRDTARDQPESFGDEARFSPAQLEAALDRIVRMAQEVDAQLRGVGISLDWSSITNKPLTFPASVHTHTASEVTDFATAGDARWLQRTQNFADLTSASTARANLGVAIGTNVQAYSANLTTFAAIAPGANVQTLLGSADYTAFRTSLGLAIGTNVQAYNANLTTFAAIAPSANVQALLGSADYAAVRTSLGLVIGTNVQTYSANLTTFAAIAPSANVQTLLGSADYAAFRTSLGLVIGTNVQAYNANLTTFAAIAPSANVQALLGSADYAAVRTSLGLVIGTNVQAYSANLTTFAAIAPSANVQTLLAAADYAAMRTDLGLTYFATGTDASNLTGSVPAARMSSNLSAALDSAFGSVQGDILYRNASSWTALAPGTSGQVLQTNGAAANPSWATPAGGSVSVTYGYTYTAPAFASVSALLHFDGTNGSTTITDQVGNTWTAAGTAAISTAQSVFGGSSLLVPGSGNSGISMPTNSGFNVGSGEWTIEFQWKYNGAPQTSARIFQTRNGDVNAGIGINIDASSVMTIFMSSTGSSFDIVNGSTLTTLSQSAWNNVLIQHRINGGSHYIETFVNGSQKGQFLITGSPSVYYNAADSVIIGGNVSGASRSMNAYIEEFRFTKGVALATLQYPTQTSAFPNS